MIRTERSTNTLGLIALFESADGAPIPGVLYDNKPCERPTADRAPHDDHPNSDAESPVDEEQTSWACTTLVVDDDRVIGRDPSEETVYVDGQARVYSLRRSPASRKNTTRSHAERDGGGSPTEIAFFGLVPKA